MEREMMKSLVKAFEILKLFSDSRSEMTLSEISKLSGLPKATTGRIVSVLVKHNYLQQQEKRGKYSLGTIYLGYSGIVKRAINIRKIAMPHLTNLSHITNETVVFAFREATGKIFSEAIHDTTGPNRFLRIAPEEGYGMPLHATSVGKIFLAELSDGELKKYFNMKSLVSYTPNTITEINSMKEHIRTMQQAGCAFDNEEYCIGIRGVGAGIRNDEGTLVAAAGVAVPSVRLTELTMRELEINVKNCAMKISNDLGFVG